MTFSAAAQDILKPGETRIYKAQYAVKNTDICSDIINNATTKAIGPCYKAVTSNRDTATVYMRYIAAISLKKLSDKPGKKANAGDKITYIYNISNKGNVNLTDISVSDNTIKSVRYIFGDNNHHNWLNLSEIWVYEGAYTVQESDLCSDIVNTAVVKAKDPCNRLGTFKGYSSCNDKLQQNHLLSQQK